MNDSLLPYQQRDYSRDPFADWEKQDWSGLQKYLDEQEAIKMEKYRAMVQPDHSANEAKPNDGAFVFRDRQGQIIPAPMPLNALPPPPKWMDSYKSFQADHVRNFGEDMNRPWNADADAKKAKDVIDQQYIDNVKEYNNKYSKYGAIIGIDSASLGHDAQPNTYTPTDHSHDGALGGVAKSLGMTTNQLVGGAALAVGGWAIASAMAPTAAAAAAPVAETAAATGTTAAATAVPQAGIIESALASPIAKPALNAGITLAKTGNVNKALTAGAGAYVGSEFIAPAVGGWAKETLGASDAIGSTIGNAASVVTQGGDPIKALQSGAVGVAARMITSAVPGFDNLGKSMQAAITNAVSAQLTGKSPTDALIASARSMAIKMATDSAMPKAGPNTKDFVNTVAGTVLPQVGSKKRRR